MFERSKSYFVRSNKVFETCCFHHHIEFYMHYQVFKKFLEDTYGFHATPPSRPSEFISFILCEKIDDLVGLINCIKGICEMCGELTLFYLKIENINVSKTMN